MLNRLFGNYLVNRGYLNPAQLDDLLETITEYKADPQTVILVNKFLHYHRFDLYSSLRCRKNHLRKRHFACNC